MECKSERCIVKGCLNEQHQGNFVGDICSPCYVMITSGDASKPSTNFIHDLFEKAQIAKKQIKRLLEE